MLSDLRNARKAAGKRLREVAQAIGCTVGYLSDAERGTRHLPVPVLAKILLYLKVPEQQYRRLLGNEIVRRSGISATECFAAVRAAKKEAQDG